MTQLIIIVVCVYSISVLAAYELGRYDRRHQGTDIEGQWWVSGIMQDQEINFEELNKQEELA